MIYPIKKKKNLLGLKIKIRSRYYVLSNYKEYL